MAAASITSPWQQDACYWLPRDMSGLGPTQNAIVDHMSMLCWIDASEACWNEDGDIVEHAEPPGFEATELAKLIYDSAEPTWREVRGVEKSLSNLMARGLVEPSFDGHGRFRLRGWNCLHTRRRTTRRAIEHGGGRAVYMSVRFSA